MWQQQRGVVMREIGVIFKCAMYRAALGKIAFQQLPEGAEGITLLREDTD